MHQQEAIDTQLGSGADQVVGERFCTGHDDRSGEQEQRGHRERRARGQGAQRRSGADQLGFLDIAAAQLVQIETEPAQQ